MLTEKTHTPFQQTQWTWIDALDGADESRRRAAMDRLVRLYWPSVYSCVRAAGYASEESSEQTQAYFAEVVVRRRLFERADRERGRLRSLIKQSVKNFLTDALRKDGRKPTVDHSSVQHLEADNDRHESDTASVSDLFDRRWAASVLEEAVQRCRQRLEQSGRQREWKAFDAWVWRPSVNGVSPVSAAAVASDLDLVGPAQVYAAVRTVRRRVLTTLREVVAEQVADAGDVEDELALVARLLGS